MTEMRQVLISNGTTQQTAWVEDDSRLKPLCEITFKDSDDIEKRWKVLRIYDNIIEKNTLYKLWRVGGLQ